MVRLISSRLHRCYSHRSLQKSARIENVSTVLHVFACVFHLLSHSLSPFPTFNTHFLLLSSLLLLFIHLLDLHATLLAHRKFYRLSKLHKRPITFLSVPTKVDALSAFLYLCGSLPLFLSTTGLLSLSWLPSSLISYIPPLFYIFSFIACSLNLTLALPSLDFGVPTALARAQNFILVLFSSSTLITLCTIILPLSAQLPQTTSHLLAHLSFCADFVILFGSLCNALRVSRFLVKTRYWAMEDLKPVPGRVNKGLLSWFKSPRDASVDASDFDSDDLDEFDNDFDNDDWQKPSSRRPAV